MLSLIYADRLYIFTTDPSAVYPLPIPAPLPNNQKQAEEEIVASVLDFIIQYEIGGTIDYIRNSGQPWVDAPPNANIIVWGPVKEEDFEWGPELDYNQIIQVWWYADGQLTEAMDKDKAIEEYQQNYMQDANTNIWAWGFYDFAILSVAEDKQTAEIYVGASCGPLCGHGYIYTLRRSSSGQWGIIRANHMWQS